MIVHAFKPKLNLGLEQMHTNDCCIEVFVVAERFFLRNILIPQRSTCPTVSQGHLMTQQSIHNAAHTWTGVIKWRGCQLLSLPNNRTPWDVSSEWKWCKHNACTSCFLALHDTILAFKFWITSMERSGSCTSRSALSAWTSDVIPWPDLMKQSTFLVRESIFCSWCARTRRTCFRRPAPNKNANKVVL